MLTLLNALTALVIGLPVTIVATVTDTKPQLCAAMKGTYDPKAPDQCAGGDWVRIVPLLRHAAPTKEK
jgi:hypothetical protein